MGFARVRCEECGHEYHIKYNTINDYYKYSLEDFERLQDIASKRRGDGKFVLADAKKKYEPRINKAENQLKIVCSLCGNIIFDIVTAESLSLIHWSLASSSELEGYGFPFDQSNLCFYRR